MVPSLVLADILTNLQKKCLVCVGAATASCAGSAVGTQETMAGSSVFLGTQGEVTTAPLLDWDPVQRVRREECGDRCQ